MPENNFEIKVQQQMEGFRLKPAASVWKEVEDRIRRKRRRRIIFWWFIPALLLGSGAGVAYLYYSTAPKEDNNKAAAVKPAGSKTGAVNEKEEPAAHSNIAQHTTNNTHTIPSVPASGPVKPVTIQSTPATGKPNQITAAEKPGDGPGVTAMTGKKNYTRPISISGKPGRNAYTKKSRESKPPTAQVVPAQDLPASATAVQLPVDPSGENEVAATMQETATSNDKVANREAADSAHADKLQAPALLADGLFTDKEQEPVADNTIPVRVRRKRTGSWEISAGKGISVESDGIVSAKRAERLFAFSAGDPAVLPANLEAGNAFSFQVNRRIPLKKRLDLVAGISYDYYSTRQWVGAYMAASPQFPAVGGGSGMVHNGPYYSIPYIGVAYNQFNNRYHLAGLSGGLIWKWVDRKNFSIGWRNSINLQYLISAHALQFDASIPGYALSNAGLNRLQPGFTTGIDLLLFRKILVRPFHTLQLSHMSKYNSNFINATGIHIGILFNRK